MGKLRIALIPAFDPGPCLLAVLEEMNEKGFTIVVVNDGSSRESDDLFRKADEYAEVLTHDKNCGKGRALKTGLAYIQNHFHSDYVVVTMDADGQHTARDAEFLCNLAEERKGQLILGSRKLETDAPLRSRFGNAVTRAVCRLATGRDISDTQTGLRAFDDSLVSTLLKVPGERYEYEMNVLLDCARAEISVTETEIETIYLDKNEGSHFRVFRDSILIYREILKFSASSFTGFLVDYAIYSILLAVLPHLSGNASPGASLVAANIGARIVSATVNYTMNRKLVFKSNASVTKSAAEYCLLAAGILAGNTLVLSALVTVCNMNRYLAKLCTEAVFFIVSWQVQRRFIFRQRQDVGRDAEQGIGRGVKQGAG
ncbi:MAG: bifunctional glycosyltransferase family 2/GtrA family protein [Lachnospiraceae bacterium]|nr:bifunctional glycosyltransferase family 2/GtrA family protein [Lachnospiraceae bacterium]